MLLSSFPVVGLYRMMNDLIHSRYQIDIEEFRNLNPKIHEVPFNSSNKWQMSIHQVLI